MPVSPRVLRRVAVLVGLAVFMSGCVRGDLEYLASDASDGRNNATAGSVRAQDYLLAYLTTLTVGANSAATGNDAYKQVFTGGTNIIGMIPGTDLADQYVIDRRALRPPRAQLPRPAARRRHLQRRDRQRGQRRRSAPARAGVRVRAAAPAPHDRRSRSGTARRTACSAPSTTRSIRWCRSPRPSRTSTSTSRARTSARACATSASRSAPRPAARACSRSCSRRSIPSTLGTRELSAVFGQGSQ